MIDRGVLAVGMAADVTVLDPATIADKSTYEKPSELSQGIRFVVVNGRVALEDGARRLVRSGAALYRTSNMPSRPVSDGARALTVSGTAADRKIAISLTQDAGARSAKGTLTIENLGTIEAGLLQTTTGWAAVSGTTGQHAINVIVDLHDPHNRGNASVIVDVDGYPRLRGSLPATAVTIR
jgi:hypothetical protein